MRMKVTVPAEMTRPALEAFRKEAKRYRNAEADWRSDIEVRMGAWAKAIVRQRPDRDSTRPWTFDIPGDDDCCEYLISFCDDWMAVNEVPWQDYRQRAGWLLLAAQITERYQETLREREAFWRAHEARLATGS
jgi:hypothetical protein